MHCQRQLGELQESYRAIQDLGAEIVALSADWPEVARTTVAELGLTFPVLSDASRKRIIAWDVLHPGQGIAKPTLFVLDREGEVRWKHVGKNAADRPDIEDVLKQLRKLQ